METTTTTLTNAIAELTAQVEQLTAKNLELQKTVQLVNSSEVNDGVISAIIKTIPRETILEVLGVKDVNLEDVDSAVLIEYVSDNFGVDEVFTNQQIIEYVQRDIDMDDVYDQESIVEWVKDNRRVSEVYESDCVTDFEIDDVLTEFGEESVMDEVENQGWSKSKDVSDIISTLEEVIESLKA